MNNIKFIAIVFSVFFVDLNAWWFKKSTGSGTKVANSSSLGAIQDVSYSGTYNVIVRSAEDVFGSCISSQRCYLDQSFDEMPDRLNEFFLQKFNKHYLKQKDKLSLFVPFFNNVTEGYVSENGEIIDLAMSGEFRQNFSTIYQLVENNMPRFIEFLREHDFLLELNTSNDNSSSNANVIDTINKFNIFGRLLFSNPDKNIERERMFAFANRCFEYCFGTSTWPDFNKHVTDLQDNKLVKFLYSTIWYNLVGQGWKDWQGQTLAQITEKSRQGVRVVYVAGGMDIYQLLKYGIYNIDIIDPFLPTQGKYYASKYWEWFIKGDGRDNGLDDRIVFDFDGRKINLIRKKYSKNGTFIARLSSGRKQKIEKSVTDWMVSDHDNRYLGMITVKRRFCEQGDFFVCSNWTKLSGTECLILMSFNEIYYAFLPKEKGGWGISTKKLPENFKIYAKQLRNPVDVDILENIKKAEDTNFKFVRLGSDPT